MQNRWLVLCIVHCALCIGCALCTSSCRIPNMTSPQCIEARDAVKEFYSFHFGNDMRPTPENLRLRERFLTPELATSLKNAPPASTVDYFTETDQAPKTFKIGKCESPDPTHATLQVQLYWRDDIETVQKEVHAEAIKSGDTWLINKVTN
jgi:hypothetical protein